MRVCRTILWLAGMAAVLAPSPALGAVKTISDVPNYTWYGGCGPTAAGMIIGFWDDHGLENLITAGDGTNSWATNQNAVKAMIASDGYLNDWYPDPDRLEPPAYHADDSVADFMQASRGAGIEPGWSKATKQDNGMTGYAAYRGYTETRGAWIWYDYLWESFVEEIDAGRPMELYVDSTGNGIADHFVTAFGYDDTPGAEQYFGYDTSGGAGQWHDFRGLEAGQAWRISAGTWFTPFVPSGPTADAGGPYTLHGVAGELVLDGSGSSDTDATILSWNWDLDGDWIPDLTGESRMLTAALLELLGWEVGESRLIMLEVTDHLYGYDMVTTTLTYSTTPEPATAGLLVVGFAAVLLRRRRRSRMS